MLTNRITIATLSLTLAILGACSDTTAGGDAGPETHADGSPVTPEIDAAVPNNDIPLDEWRTEILRARCTMSCFGFDSWFDGEDDCVENLESSFFGGTVTYELDEALAGVKAGRITYDAAAARECVDQLLGLVCTHQIQKRNTTLFKMSNFPACRDVFVGSVQEGELCYTIWDCEGGDYNSLCIEDEDEDNTCGWGTCVTQKFAGGSCDPTSKRLECADDFYCDATDNVCRARLDDGEGCIAPPADVFGFTTQPCPLGHLCLDGVCGTPPESVISNASCWINNQCPAENSCERQESDMSWRCLEFLPGGGCMQSRLCRRCGVHGWL